MQKVRAAGLFTAIPALPWVWNACAQAAASTLGRDQGIFQYIAWAVSRGDVAYRDVRDVNGPLTYLFHHVMLGLGGADEFRFRVLDLCFVAITAGILGWCLPSLTRGMKTIERASAALGMIAVVLTEYLGYGFWDIAQRESFFDGLILVAIAMQIEGTARKSPKLIAIAGAFATMPIFGKPTYAVFTIAQLLALMWDGMSMSRKHRLGWFALGGVGGAAVPLGWLLIYGDMRAWIRITFVDVPAMYRFIWPRPLHVILELFRNGIVFAGVVSFVLIACVLLHKLPRRALPIGTFALAGMISLFVQRKGFPYHVHPVTLGSTIAFFTLAWWLLARAKKPVMIAFASLLAVGLGVRTAYAAFKVPFPTVEDSRDIGMYERVDFFPAAMRATAKLLAKNTKPDERVQIYGMDPYILFLAERKSATPYIYAYDLDAYWALRGAYEEGGPVPTEQQRAVIRAMRDDHEKDLLARFEREPPAAFVFVGHSPLMTQADALDDFQIHCPDAASWFLLRYREAENFEGIRVFFRADRMGEP